MRVGVAYVDVRVNMAQYKKDLDSLVNNAQNATAKVNATMSKMGTGYSKVKTGATGASTGMDKVTASAKKQSRSMLGLIPHVAMVTASYMAMRVAWRALMSGLGAGIEFEQKMSVVSAVSRATAEEFKLLEAAARQYARGTVFTATQTAEALKFLAMAGFNAKESIDALPGVLNLALIGELELGRATDIATDTLKAFGMEAWEITRAVDVMVAIITRSNTNIEMMGQAMKFAAPVARALGYDIEQVSAMIGTLAQSGVKAGIAGRNLQQSFIRTMGAAKNLGMGIGTDLIGVLKKYDEIQKKLAAQIGETAAREKVAWQIKKDYGLIALKSILILKDNVEQYERLEKAARGAAGETWKAAKIMQDNVDSAWKLVKSAIEDVSIEVFGRYKNGLKDFLLSTADWFRSNRDSITEYVSAIGKDIGGLVDTLAPIGKALAEIVKQIDKLASAYSSLPANVAGPVGVGLIVGILGRSTTIGLVAGAILLTVEALKKLDEALPNENRKNLKQLLEDANTGNLDMGKFIAAIKKASGSFIEDVDSMTSAWNNFKSDFQMEDKERLSYINADAIKASLKAFQSLSPEIKKIFYDALAFEGAKEKAVDTFGGIIMWVKELQREMGTLGYSDEVITAALKKAEAAFKTFYNKLISEGESSAKSVIKRKEKLAADELKLTMSTKEKELKIAQDKSDDLIKKLYAPIKYEKDIAEESARETIQLFQGNADAIKKINENLAKNLKSISFRYSPNISAIKQEEENIAKERTLINLKWAQKSLASQAELSHEGMKLNLAYAQKTDEYWEKLRADFAAKKLKGRIDREKNEEKAIATEIAAQIKLYTILTDTLKVRDDQYFEYKQALLKFEYDKYVELFDGDSGKLALLMKAYYQTQRENMREQLRASESFFDGLSASFDEASEDMLTMGDLGYEMGKQFSDNATSALSETLLDGFKTGFDNIEDIWTKMLDNMLAAYLDFLSKMLVQQMMLKLAQAFPIGNIGAGFTSPGGLGGAGGWNLPRGGAGGGGYGFQHGGWIDEPVMGIGTKTGKSYSIGEVEPEYIMPKSKMKGVVQEKGGGGFGENAPPNVSIVVQNNTGVEAKSYTEQPRFDGEGWIIGVVMDAYDRNKSGMRDVMRRR